MKLEIAPDGEKQSAHVIRRGRDSRTVTAFSLNADILSQKLILPAIWKHY